jgi:hypothetical protein
MKIKFNIVAVSKKERADRLYLPIRSDDLGTKILFLGSKVPFK